MIPGAQRSRWWPVGFGGAYRFGSGAVEHDRRVATSVWSMAPDPSYLLRLGALAIPNSNLRGTTRKLRLVTLELCVHSSRWAPLRHPLLLSGVALAPCA